MIFVKINFSYFYWYIIKLNYRIEINIIPKLLSPSTLLSNFFVELLHLVHKSVHIFHYFKHNQSYLNSTF